MEILTHFTKPSEIIWSHLSFKHKWLTFVGYSYRSSKENEQKQKEIWKNLIPKSSWGLGTLLMKMLFFCFTSYLYSSWEMSNIAMNPMMIETPENETMILIHDTRTLKPSETDNVQMTWKPCSNFTFLGAISNMSLPPNEELSFRCQHTFPF